MIGEEIECMGGGVNKLPLRLVHVDCLFFAYEDIPVLFFTSHTSECY